MKVIDRNFVLLLVLVVPITESFISSEMKKKFEKFCVNNQKSLKLLIKCLIKFEFEPRKITTKPTQTQRKINKPKAISRKM
jgi:hypothetical protein